MKIKFITTKIKWWVISFGVLGSVISSCDYLDVDQYIYDITPIDSVFTTPDKLLQYINGIADYLPAEDRLWTNAWSPFQGASDETFNSWNDNRHAAMKFLLDEITPAAANSHFNNYNAWYKGITKASTVLSRMDEVDDLSTTARRRYTGEMHFFRGYFTYLLLQQYGPVAIMPDHLLDFNADAEALMYERQPYDSCVSYIVSEMEQAVNYLPSVSEGANIYRPTSGVALAVQSRVLLVAASPLFNGNNAYVDWKRTSDGVNYISQTVDNSKWGKAAVAAKRLIESGMYSLYVAYSQPDTEPLAPNVPTADFPDGAGNIDPYRSYKSLFSGEVSIRTCPEFIWARPVNPRGDDSPLWISSPAELLGGGNGLNVTQSLVDAYRMQDGRTIHESSAEYPYPDAGALSAPVGQAKDMGGYKLYSSQTSGMYANREARFYASIGFSHSIWPGTSYSGSEEARYRNAEITYYSDGSAAPSLNFPVDYNHTGYTCIKYNHPEDNMRATGSIQSKYFGIFRYAEILLNYAEALNELDGSYTEGDMTVTRNVDEIARYFNQVRFRAGLPGLSSEEMASRESLREAIKRERQVEFACEGRRYHDLRRWKDAPVAYSSPIKGMNVYSRGSEREKYYTVTVINEPLTQRTWSNKMYFWPIPLNTMNKNSKLDQNPGW